MPYPTCPIDRALHAVVLFAATTGIIAFSMLAASIYLEG